jgi:hypothetical protein
MAFVKQKIPTIWQLVDYHGLTACFFSCGAAAATLLLIRSLTVAGRIWSAAAATPLRIHDRWVREKGGRLSTRKY